MPREPMRQRRPTVLPAYAPRARSVRWAGWSSGEPRPVDRSPLPASPAPAAAATAAARTLAARTLGALGHVTAVRRGDLGILDRRLGRVGPLDRRALRALPLAALATLATATIAARAALAAALAPGAVATLLHPLGLRHERLARQAQASALVAIDELDRHPVALLHDVLGLLRASVLELGDVDESLRAGEDLDEGAEGGRALDRALVRPADLRLLRDRLHHLLRPLHRLAADGGDRDDSLVVDRDLGAGLVLDAANRLPLRADQVADLLGADLDGDDAWRVRRELLARPGERLV